MGIKIIGAGYAGLLSGLCFPGASIIERGPRGLSTHSAVLRFRSNAVSRMTGIKFKKVFVRKGIWSCEKLYDKCNITFANQYSRKVTGGAVGDRSIWNLDAVERWIAPPYFRETLIEMLGDKIEWHKEFTTQMLINAIDANDAVISTVPLPVMLKIAGSDLSTGKLTDGFKTSKINTVTYQINNCDVHQTVYFPDRKTPVYRASITESNLIIEYTNSIQECDIDDVLDAFGLNRDCIKETLHRNLGSVEFAKMMPIDEDWRQGVIGALTQRHNIYSIGRLATWRPGLLLDDVIEDANAVKGILYQRSR